MLHLCELETQQKVTGTFSCVYIIEDRSYSDIYSTINISDVTTLSWHRDVYVGNLKSMVDRADKTAAYF